jgi:hypothetical protein
VKRRAAWLCLCVLGAAAAAMLVRDDSARIVSTRFARHDRYDRLVIELDRGASIVRRPETRWDDLIVDVSATPSEPQHEIETGSPRAGSLSITAIPGGARLTGARRERQLRLFQLQDPPRLIVDFADPEGTTLSAPGKAMAVPVDPSPHGFSAEAALELFPSSEASATSHAVAAGAPFESEDEERMVLASHSHSTPPGWMKRLLYGVPLALMFGALAALASRLTLDAWSRLWTAPGTRAFAARGMRAFGSARGRPHDDEVVSRMELEDRVEQLRREVEQLRAGLSRLTREEQERA